MENEFYFKMRSSEWAQYKKSIIAGKPRAVPRELHSTEVDLLTRSGSVADPMAKDRMTTPGKPSSIKVQRSIRLTCEVPPLKREDGVGRPLWTAG